MQVLEICPIYFDIPMVRCTGESTRDVGILYCRSVFLLFITGICAITRYAARVVPFTQSHMFLYFRSARYLPAQLQYLYIVVHDVTIISLLYKSVVWMKKMGFGAASG